MELWVLADDDAKSIQIDAGGDVEHISFTPDGRHIVTGEKKCLRRWQLADGVQVGRTMDLGGEIRCMTVSRNGQWIVAGTSENTVEVWDANTHEKTVEITDHKEEVEGQHYGPFAKRWFQLPPKKGLIGVDVSPDSSRLASASVDNSTLVWAISSGKQLFGPLQHEGSVEAVRFSPDGGKIATLACSWLHIWDCTTGSHERVVMLDRGRSLLAWSSLSDGQRIFVSYSHRSFGCYDPSTRSLYDLPVNNLSTSTNEPSLAIAHNGTFIVCAGGRLVRFWDTTMTTTGRIPKPIGPAVMTANDIKLVALSPDNQYFAMLQRVKTTVLHLQGILPDHYIDSDFVFDKSPLRKILPVPFTHISPRALTLWSQDKLTDAEATLSDEITSHPHSCHHALAYRALARARLKQWDAALEDANESLQIKPSTAGYIGKSMALAGQGKLDLALAFFGSAFRYCDAQERERSFLLLIKSIVSCMSGNYRGGISRVDELIDHSVDNRIVCRYVKAHMSVALGTSYIEKGEYECAIKLLEGMDVPAPFHTIPELDVISLLFGYRFDDLGSIVQRRLQECLDRAGRINEGIS